MHEDRLTIQGTSVPRLGFGTWQLTGDACRQAVRDALEIGYRHIDTAQIYRNEAEVGLGISDSGLPRSQFFLTTKVWYEQARAEQVMESSRESLRKLGVDEVDLLLFHWPNPDVPMAETLGGLSECVSRGYARHIGISNHTAEQVRAAVETCREPLFTNQVEYHPFLSQQPLLPVLKEAGMALTAYSPLAQGAVFNDPTLRGIGERHGKNPGQVALRWLLQQDGVLAIPKATGRDHIESNFQVRDFLLSDEEMETIHALARPDGRMIDPEWAPEWDC